ncbi:hypothetical protein CLOP_g2010 [Closterium sp. NIES-67]|nr:hypothetical protein CLOP_g2010 [Closterium sp. NIES-67]
MAQLLLTSSSLCFALAASPTARLQSRASEHLSSRRILTLSPLPVSATIDHKCRREISHRSLLIHAQAKSRPRKQSPAKPSAKPSPSSSEARSAPAPAAKATPPPVPRVSPPESLEDALRQAGECVAAAVRAASRAAEPMTLKQRKQIRGRVGGGAGGAASAGARFQVEIPLRDDSPQVLAETAQDLVRRAVAQVQWRGGAGRGASVGGNAPASCAVSLLFGPAAAATAAAADPNKDKAGAGGAGGEGGEGGAGPAGGAAAAAVIEWDIASLSERQSVPRDAALVCIVGPTEDQAGKVKSVLNSAGQMPVLLLNPAWASAPAAAAAAAAGGADASSSLVADLVKEFDVVYCFMPLAVQGLFGGNEGALMRVVGGADGGGPGAVASPVPWVLLTQKKGESAMRPLTALPARPDAERIETILYASVASDSPISKGVQFFKAIIGQGGGKAV